jgi:hypothetical protein
MRRSSRPGLDATIEVHAIDRRTKQLNSAKAEMETQADVNSSKSLIQLFKISMFISVISKI